MGAQVVTVNDVLDGHVVLDIQCLDRIYLNAYVPKLQTSAQVVAFLSGHLGYPFPSPALFNQIGQRFRRAVASFAEANDIPWVKFGKDDVGGKLELMRPHLARQAVTGQSGVAAIGVAQEFQRVSTAYERQTSTGAVQWWFTKADRRVTFISGMPISGRPSLRSAAIFLIRPRFGSTGMSGPNAKPPRPGSDSPSCPTGSLPPAIRLHCKTSVIGSVQAPSTSSSSGGWPVCHCR